MQYSPADSIANAAELAVITAGIEFLEPVPTYQFAARSLDDVPPEARLTLQRCRPRPSDGLRVRVARHYCADELRWRREVLGSQKVIHDLREALTHTSQALPLARMPRSGIALSSGDTRCNLTQRTKSRRR